MSADERRPPDEPTPPSSSARPAEEPRTGFGSTRWADAPPPKNVGEDDPRLEKSPFGGASWSPSEAVADASEDEALGAPAEGSTGRRRREDSGPKHPRRTVAALGAAVEVVRDAAGIPHLFAKRERDAYAALGFCMAEDRLWEMDLQRRIACGRAAELLGPAAMRLDALVRTAGIPRRAAAVANRVDGVARELLAAFAGGVNAARAIVKPKECEELGYEIDPWTVADSLAIEFYLAWKSAIAAWTEKIRVARAWSTEGAERARCLSRRPLESVWGDPERLALWSRIDRRLLELVEGAAGSLATVPEACRASAGYVARLDAPEFRVIGVSRLGVPALCVGRNSSLAWAAGCVSMDDADCVLEELDGIGHFRTESGWAKLGTRHEVVRVRGGEARKLEVAETRNGPLLSHLIEQLDGPAGEGRPVSLAFRWGPNSLTTSLGGLLALARARSVSEVEQAARVLDRSATPMEIVAMDRSGATSLVLAGGVPVRDAAAALPVRGWLSEARWSSVAGLSAGGIAKEAHGAVSLAGPEAGAGGELVEVSASGLGPLRVELEAERAWVSIEARATETSGDLAAGSGAAPLREVALELDARPTGEIVELVPG